MGTLRSWEPGRKLGKRQENGRKWLENDWKMTGKWLESGNLEDDCRTFGT
jgi:hypothetical protein